QTGVLLPDQVLLLGLALGGVALLLLLPLSRVGWHGTFLPSWCYPLVPLIHEPTEAVSFGTLPLGSSVDDAFHLLPHGLEVTEAAPQRRLQVRQRVEQAVVRRPPPQLLPEPLDRVQLRAVARQPPELQMRVVPQRLVDGPAAMPGGVVDQQHHARVLLP